VQVVQDGARILLGNVRGFRIVILGNPRRPTPMNLHGRDLKEQQSRLAKGKQAL
jgi:hypothetical protein